MKTKSSLRKLMAACALLVCLILPSAFKAQPPAIPYPVTNLLLCPVNITFNNYNAACAMVCPPVNITIPAGATVPLPLCMGTWDIDIIVNWVNGPMCPIFQAVPANINCPPVNRVVPLVDINGCCGATQVTTKPAGAVIQ